MARRVVRVRRKPHRVLAIVDLDGFFQKFAGRNQFGLHYRDNLCRDSTIINTRVCNSVGNFDHNERPAKDH